MARGLTELDVHQAADDIVSGGERPTVERIRDHLGSGSPNTVTRHLDSWWSSVGARLRQRGREQARPDVPAAVDALALRCWTAALEAAGEHARAAVAGERADLAAAQATLIGEREAQAQDRAHWLEQLSQAEHRASTLDATAMALREQLQQIGAQADDLQRQRDGAFARNERLDQQLAALSAQLEAQGRQHEHERAELRAHIRATEEHALGEVDRARQALWQCERSANAAQAQHARQLATAEATRRKAETAATAAQRELQVQTALAAGYAAQLGALGDLPEQLRAAIDTARPAAVRRRRRAAPGTP